MAGNENVPPTSTEDSLSVRLQWLRQRREKLQEKLAQKNNELKNLCVEEAELTGILPPEIPLEPGESPPIFRKHMGTAFTYPQNLINRLKSNEAEESAVELERQVQIGIVEAALAIVNDPTENKAVRRKHRLVYQQSQHRLQELDARLNFIRQCRGKPHQATQFQHLSNCNTQSHVSIKHRTKKPRPPLDNTGTNGSTKSTRNILQEGGVCLSPLETGQKCDTYPGHRHEDQGILNVCNHKNTNIYTGVDTVERQNIKIIDQDQNDNHSSYILADQYRSRTFSHGNNSFRSHNNYSDLEKVHRPVQNSYKCDDDKYNKFDQQFHKGYSQFLPQSRQKLQHLQQYSQELPNNLYMDYKNLDGHIQQKINQGLYEKDSRPHQYLHGTDYHLCYKNLQTQKRQDHDISVSRNSRYGGSSVDSHLSSGYWIQYDDDVIWYPEEVSTNDRFGSLDRRKRNVHQYTTGMNNEGQSRYRTVAIGPTKSSISGSQQQQLIQLLPLSEQTAEHKMLLRTQSLGSMECGQSQESRGKNTTDNANYKIKEKEWYETSLDSGTSPGLDVCLMNFDGHKMVRCQSSPTSYLCKVPGTMFGNNEINVKDNYVNVSNRTKKEFFMEDSQFTQSNLVQSRFEQRPKVLEIPAESKSFENNNEAICLGSPQNCTIVQAGKYQPYREVTKPFEMSDFYKYSTKFRKKNAQQDSKSMEANGTGDLCSESNSSRYKLTGVNTNSVQKKIYQPVQRMTCQPYNTNLR